MNMLYMGSKSVNALKEDLIKIESDYHYDISPLAFKEVNTQEEKIDIDSDEDVKIKVFLNEQEVILSYRCVNNVIEIRADTRHPSNASARYALTMFAILLAKLVVFGLSLYFYSVNFMDNIFASYVLEIVPIVLVSLTYFLTADEFLKLIRDRKITMSFMHFQALKLFHLFAVFALCSILTNIVKRLEHMQIEDLHLFVSLSWSVGVLSVITHYSEPWLYIFKHMSILPEAKKFSDPQLVACYFSYSAFLALLFAEGTALWLLQRYVDWNMVILLLSSNLGTVCACLFSRELIMTSFYLVCSLGRVQDILFVMIIFKALRSCLSVK